MSRIPLRIRYDFQLLFFDPIIKRGECFAIALKGSPASLFLAMVFSHQENFAGQEPVCNSLAKNTIHGCPHQSREWIAM